MLIVDYETLKWLQKTISDTGFKMTLLKQLTKKELKRTKWTKKFKRITRLLVPNPKYQIIATKE